MGVGRVGKPRTLWEDGTRSASGIVSAWNFFEEITRSAVPVDLRAIRQLQRSPLAIDLYVWLTYRMSYLKKPTLISWKSLEAQFGADYSRTRDFRRRALDYLKAIVRVYSRVRVSPTDTGLCLYPSAPHVLRSKRPTHWDLEGVSAPSR